MQQALIKFFGGNMKKLAILLVTSSLISGCKGGPIETTPPPFAPVQISEVVNAIKCELAQTFADGRYKTKVKSDISGSLKLTEILAKKTDGEGGVELEIGPVTLGGTGSASQSRTAQNALDITFDYLDVHNASVPAYCSALAQSVYVKGDPFVDILDGLVAEYGRIEKGAPKVQLKAIEYSVAFDLEREMGANGEISVIIFKIGGGYSETRTSSRELTLTFDLDKDGLPPRIPL